VPPSLSHKSDDPFASPGLPLAFQGACASATALALPSAQPQSHLRLSQPLFPPFHTGLGLTAACASLPSAPNDGVSGTAAPSNHHGRQANVVVP